MSRLATIVIIVLLVLFSAISIADDKRARTNYQIHCQGCHLPDAAGVPGNVPRMKNFVGYFLHSSAGREFIVQVPGPATSNLSDQDLAELMNWMLLTYSAGQLPEKFRPYTTEEVAALRPDLQADPDNTRKVILRDIAIHLPELAELLETSSVY